MADLPILLKRMEMARRKGDTPLAGSLWQEVVAAQATCPHANIIDSRAPADIPGVTAGQRFTKCADCTKLLTVDNIPVA